MTTTTATTYGAEFGFTAQTDGIRAFVNDAGYTADEAGAVFDALLAAFRSVVDGRLPDGVLWQPITSEFIHPVDVDLPDRDEMTELFREAWAATADRIEAIESEVLGA
jgi:hypothetical protein